MDTFSIYGNIKAPLRRIISLAPSITELLFYMGMGDAVVGVTRQCDYPEETKNKETIGSFLIPDTERIAALEPDAVIGLGNLHKHIPKMARNEGGVILLDYHNVPGILDVMEAIGSLAQNPEAALSPVARLHRRVDELQADSDSRRPVRTFFLISESPLFTPSRNSYQYDALKIAGAEQLTTGYTQYERVTPEEVVHFNPEVILACGRHRGAPPPKLCPDCRSAEPICQRIIEDIAAKPQWRETDAAIKGNIMALPCSWLCRPGPRLIDGMEAIARILRDYQSV